MAEDWRYPLANLVAAILILFRSLPRGISPPLSSKSSGQRSASTDWSNTLADQCGADVESRTRTFATTDRERAPLPGSVAW